MFGKGKPEYKYVWRILSPNIYEGHHVLKELYDHLVSDERSRNSRGKPPIFDDKHDLERETCAYLTGS